MLALIALRFLALIALILGIEAQAHGYSAYAGVALGLFITFVGSMIDLSIHQAKRAAKAKAFADALEYLARQGPA